MSNPSTTPTTKRVNSATAYENNPFFVAINGIDLLFKKARSVGIAIAILVAISTLGSLPSYFAPPSSSTQDKSPDSFPAIPAEVWALIIVAALVVLLIFMIIGIIIRGVMDYSSAKLANGETVTLSEAFRGLFSSFWGYAWVIVIVGVKTFLWTLLFIIPGIIMSVRYSLAGVAYFDKKLKGDGSVQHSSQLVKGAWLTTFASQNLLNIITLGIIQPLLVPGTNAVLYKQLGAIGETKPKAHLLSWLTLVIPFVLAALLIAGVLLLMAWAYDSSLAS